MPLAEHLEQDDRAALWRILGAIRKPLPLSESASWTTRSPFRTVRSVTSPGIAQQNISVGIGKTHTDARSARPQPRLDFLRSGIHLQDVRESVSLTFPRHRD